MSSKAVMAIVAAFAVALCGCGTARYGKVATTQSTTEEVVTVYSGPNMRASLETLGEQFTRRTGTRVVVVADDVRPLIARIKREEAAGQGVPDLFVTHDPFLQVAMKGGLDVREAWTCASLVPVIVVPKGNPNGITSLRDLARPGLRVGLTDAEQTISGEIMKVMFRRADIEEAVQRNVVVRTSQGRDLCKALIAGKCDVGIVWNAVVAANRDQVEAVAIADADRPRRGVDAEVESPTLGRLELDYVRVTIALTVGATHEDAARRFVAFVRTAEGEEAFAANGFSPAAPGRPALP